MKAILSILILVITAKECDTKRNEVTTNAMEPAVAQVQQRLQDSTIVTYRAATRGVFLKISIVGDSLSYTKDYNLKDWTTHAMPSDEKLEFLDLLSKIDEKELPGLEPPSKAFQYDGALMGWLQLEIGDAQYKTPIFDHGNPPEYIKPIVDKILTMQSMVEKQ